MTEYPEWEAFLVDVDGFTQRDDDRAKAILRLLPDEDAIDRAYGDCLPSEIVVCRGEAKPQPLLVWPSDCNAGGQGRTNPPKYEGSEILRLPSSRRVIDFIEFANIEHEEDPDRAVLLWFAAQGATQVLNNQTEVIL